MVHGMHAISFLLSPTKSASDEMSRETVEGKNFVYFVIMPEFSVKLETK